MKSNRELFEMYNRDVYRTCYYMLHDAADAEDLCQDVFITIFRSHWERIEHIKAWIMKITVNHCLNHLKRRNSLQQKVLANLNIFTEKVEVPIEQIIEERETAVEWAYYISCLPVKIRAVISLRYIQDLSLADISNILSIPLGTTKSRLHKGLRLLKKMLLEVGIETEIKEENVYETSRDCANASIK